jgi:large subunit ribosomal protein L29
MKVKDIRDLTNEELGQRTDDSARELLNLRMRKSGGQLENPLRIRELRREIARLNTVINERRRAAE